MAAAMIKSLDDSVGKIMKALDDCGESERTLFVFTSDNGGYLRYSGGYHNISSNGPLRGQKCDIYEGGHRVPAIAWWPGRIAPGAVCDQTTMTFDLFPTLTDLCGLPTPDGLAGRSVRAMLEDSGVPGKQGAYSTHPGGRLGVRETSGP